MLHASDKYNGRIIDKAGLIPEREPVFVLRAQDVLAIETLEYYLEILDMELERLKNDPKLSSTLNESHFKKRDELKDHIKMFYNWEKDNPGKGKLPD